MRSSRNTLILIYLLTCLTQTKVSSHGTYCSNDVVHEIFFHLEYPLLFKNLSRHKPINMDFTSNSVGDDIPPLDQQSSSAILEGTISDSSTTIETDPYSLSEILVEDEAVQSGTASFEEKAKAKGKYINKKCPEYHPLLIET